MRDATHRPPPMATLLASGDDPSDTRREELATMLLLKLVETTGGRSRYDMDVNVRAAVEYTDALLAELEKGK